MKEKPSPGRNALLTSQYFLPTIVLSSMRVSYNHSKLYNLRQTSARLLLTAQNGVTRLEEPAAISLRIITFIDKYIGCMCKVMDFITIKVFYLAKSCFFK